MGVSDGYITYVLDLFAGLGSLRVNRMFGGAGIYCDELFFAILVEDELYLKVDDWNRSDYERLELGPFIYEMKHGRSAAILEDPPRLHTWARKTMDAAVRTKTAQRS